MVGQNILEHGNADNWQIIAPCSKELNLLNPRQVEAFLDKNKPDLIIHAAGLVGGIEANIGDPIAYLDKNLMMGRNLIITALHAGVTKFLNIASTCMYPKDLEVPLKEDMILSAPLEPTNEPYALAKILTTRLCQYIQKNNKAHYFKTLIACNLYGRYDNFDPRSSHLLAAIVHKIHSAKLANNRKVEIWGDGSARREFLYAGDFADAIIRAGMDIEAIPDVMNIAVGYDHTVNDYYKFVAEVVGWEIDVVYNENKPVGMKQKLSSIELQTRWGWTPKTNLQQGIAKCYNYYLENLTPQRA